MTLMILGSRRRIREQKKHRQSVCISPGGGGSLEILGPGGRRNPLKRPDWDKEIKGNGKVNFGDFPCRNRVGPRKKLDLAGSET